MREHLSQHGYDWKELVQEDQKKVLDQFLQFVCGLGFDDLEDSLQRRAVWELMPEQPKLKSGLDAYAAYDEQYPSKIYVIEQDLKRRHKFEVTEINLRSDDKLPKAEIFPQGDIYLFHHNSKWAFLKTHEEGQMPLGDPWFLSK